MSKASRQNRLTIDEAQRALYIDFEGRKDEAPVLLGCARRRGKGTKPWVWQAVTDPLFEPLTHADDDIELLDLPDAVERILQRAEAKDRMIVAWSEHELDVVKEYCPEHLARFEARFVNARSVAVYWRNACHAGDKPPTKDLPTYLALVGYDLPDGAGPGLAGETIKRVAAALEKGRGMDGMTTDQRRRWQQLRAHNLHDCHGMKKVCILAAAELAGRPFSPSTGRSAGSPSAIGG